MIECYRKVSSVSRALAATLIPTKLRHFINTAIKVSLIYLQSFPTVASNYQLYKNTEKSLLCWSVISSCDSVHSPAPSAPDHPAAG